jgi:hypothetical protein
MKSIETTVSILTPLSDAAPLVDALGVVCQKALAACFTSLIIFTDIVPTCEGDTGWSRCLTRCMYRSLIHMWISYLHPLANEPGGQRYHYQLPRARRLA